MYRRRGIVRARLLPALVGYLIASGCSMSVPAALAAGDANRTTCAAATEATPGFHPNLPDCRAFELVSPPFKSGAVLLPTSGVVGVSGDEVLYGAAGAFGGAGNLWLNPNRSLSGSAYLSRRGPAGWSTQSLAPSAATYPHGALMAAARDDLATTLWGLTPTSLAFNEDVYLRSADGDFHLIGPGVGPGVATRSTGGPTEELSLVGASADLSHTLYSDDAAGVVQRGVYGGESNLWPGDTTRTDDPSLYEYEYDGSPRAEPTLVGVTNQGRLKSNQEAQLISECGTELGSGRAGSMYNAVSDDGRVVYFTAAACEGAPEVDELYARRDATTTVDISEPSTSDCEACNTTSGLAGATFVGASADGEDVFFTTEQELLPGAPGTRLYEYDASAGPASPSNPDGRIALLSGGPSDPGVQGVVRVSRDGTRVYYVATAALTGANAEGVEPVDGADNLYLSEPDAQHPGQLRTVFVATLLTPGEREEISSAEQTEQAENVTIAEEAGLAAAKKAQSEGANFIEAFEIASETTTRTENELLGTRGPTGTLAENESVWQRFDTRPAQATASGEVIVFLASAKLTADDTSTIPQLFRYDASSERLTRISVGRDNTFSNDGNVATFVASPRLSSPIFTPARPTAEETERALTADGATVLFASSARLTPDADSGATGMYEYRDGNVFLVSGGADASQTGHEPAVRPWGIDASGRDAFFTSASSLVPAYGDSQLALYDAREQGGVAEAAAGAGCSGEECRGPAGSAPAIALATTAVQPAGDNSPATGAPPPKRSDRTLQQRLRHCRAKHKRRRPRRRCERAARAAQRKQIGAAK
jgi:hypothetical protein